MPRLTKLAEESAKETGMGNKEDKYLKTKRHSIIRQELKI